MAVTAAILSTTRALVGRMIASGEQQSGLLYSEAALHNQQSCGVSNSNRTRFLKKWGETKGLARLSPKSRNGGRQRNRKFSLIGRT